MIQDHFVPLMPHHDPSDLGSYILIQFFPNKPPSSYVPFRGVECFRGIIMIGALKSAKHKRDNVTRKVGFLFLSLQTLQRFFEPKRWFLSKSLNPTTQPLITTSWDQLITFTVYPKIAVDHNIIDTGYFSECANTFRQNSSQTVLSQTLRVRHCFIITKGKFHFHSARVRIVLLVWYFYW